MIFYIEEGKILAVKLYFLVKNKSGNLYKSAEHYKKKINKEYSSIVDLGKQDRCPGPCLQSFKFSAYSDQASPHWMRSQWGQWDVPTLSLLPSLGDALDSKTLEYLLKWPTLLGPMQVSS